MHKLTINRFAWKNLYKNSKRYLLMAFGVLLSMVFSSGTLFFVSCLSASRRELIRMEYSQANNIAYGVPKEGLQDLDAQKPEVEYGLAHVVGFGYTDDREKGAGIAWMDALARELYYPVLSEGRLPQKEGEIAAERDALLRMGLDGLSVGETFTLNVDTPDGEAWLPEAERITYTLVGILGDKRCNIEMYFQSSRYAPALLVCPDTKTAPGGREALTAYIRYPDDYEEAFWLNHVTDGCTDGGGPSYGMSESVSRLTENAVFTAVFTGVLTLVSALGIVNAFSSDLSERKKQIGMLRAVGATKGQIVRIYGRESLFLCLLCAPVSAALSYFGVKLLTRTIENFVFIPSWGVLLGSVGAGVVFVLLASLIPLAAAARISPMQAIRNTELSRKQKRMRIRSRRRFSVPGLLAKRNLRFYRGRTVLTSLILAVTIFLSCYAFSFLLEEEDSGLRYDYRLGLSRDEPGSLIVNYTDSQLGYTENDKQTLLDLPEIARVNGKIVLKAVASAENADDYLRVLNYYQYFMLFDRSFPLTPQRYGELDAHYLPSWTAFLDALSLPETTAILPIVAVETEEIEKLSDYLDAGNIDTAKLDAGEDVVLISPETLNVRLTHFTEEEREEFWFPEVMGGRPDAYMQDDSKNMETVRRAFDAGDTLSMTVVSGGRPADGDGDMPLNPVVTQKEVRIGAVCNPAVPLDIYSGFSNCCVVTTTRGLRHFSQTYRYQTVELFATGEITEESNARIMRTIEQITSGVMSNVESDYDYRQMVRRDNRRLLTLITAVLILMLSIAGSIINNALTARIRDGKREIGTLRAVGAGVRELTRSYVLELTVMAGVGTGVGFAAFLAFCCGLGVTDWLQYGRTMPLVFPEITLWQTALGVLALFAVCAANLRRQLRRQTKHTVVENIREL